MTLGRHPMDRILLCAAATRSVTVGEVFAGGLSEADGRAVSGRLFQFQHVGYVLLVQDTRTGSVRWRTTPKGLQWLGPVEEKKFRKQFAHTRVTWE